VQRESATEIRTRASVPAVPYPLPAQPRLPARIFRNSAKLFLKTQAGQERIASGLHLCSSVDLNPSQDFAMFKLGKPETPMQWIGHVVLAIVALFLVWWLFRAYVL
jgi:hypothetical protein